MKGQDREEAQIGNFKITFYYDINKKWHDRDWEVWVNNDKVFTSTSYDVSIGVYWFLKNQNSKVLEEVLRWKQFNDFQPEVKE